MRQDLLMAVELSERETVPAGLGQEIPVRPGGVLMGQEHPSPLIGGQRIEQAHGREGDRGRVERAARSRSVRLR